jgi:hypothetical protein
MKILGLILVTMTFVGCNSSINSAEINGLKKTGSIQTVKTYMSNNKVYVDLTDDSLKLYIDVLDRNNENIFVTHSIKYTSNDSAILCFNESCQSIMIKYIDDGIMICYEDIGCVDYYSIK